jgi:large repetitive protein
VAAAGTPAHGTAAVQPDGTIRYTPAASFAGTDTFTYVVRDPAGGTATGTVTVTVANTPPVANADAAAVAENGHADIPVLANDTDPNPGQALLVLTTGVPAHGTATIRPDGQIRYTPDHGWTGVDTFTYRVSDQHGGTATGTVTVTVTGAAPVALPDHAATPYQHPVTLSPLGNDMDPNGDALTVTGVGPAAHGTVSFTAHTLTYHPADGWSGTDTFPYTVDDGHGGTSTATVTVVVGTPPVVPDRSAAARPGNPVTIGLPLTDEHHRAVTVTAVGAAAHGSVRLLAGGKVVYTPAPGFAGTDTFTYTATDADGNVATATVKVTVAGPNRAPVAHDDAVTVAAGRSVRIKPLANDSDPDHDRLTVSRVGTPRHGLAVRNADGSVTYAPSAGYLGGTDSFAYTITDGHGHSVSATVTITVVPSSGGATKLPKTGADVMSVIGAGVLTLLVGGILYAVGMSGRLQPVPAGPAEARAGWLLTGRRRRGPGRHRPGKHRPRT